MADRQVGGGWHDWREESPRISDAMARGRLVWVSARVGTDLRGYICDRDEAGLLLDVRDPSGDPTGYEFLPWHSIERVSIANQE